MSDLDFQIAHLSPGSTMKTLDQRLAELEDRVAKLEENLPASRASKKTESRKLDPKKAEK
jgi:lipid II:glycine glycyltransferase (peptidoglycan interpeptide bridge formation enzyme)